MCSLSHRSHFIDELAQDERSKQAPTHSHGPGVVLFQPAALAERCQQVHHLQLRLGRGDLLPVLLGRSTLPLALCVVFVGFRYVRILMAEQRNRRQDPLVISLMSARRNAGSGCMSVNTHEVQIVAGHE